MKRSATRWLVLLALGLFLFIFFFERRQPGTEGIQERAARVLPDFLAAEATGLDVTSSSNVSVRVERTNEAWQLRSPVI
jgi:hypothetical protein